MPYEKMPLCSAKWPSFKSSRRFVATEKIHGANFVLCCAVRCDGSVRLRYAKRGSVLDDASDFYGFREARIPQRYGDAARALAREVAETEWARGCGGAAATTWPLTVQVHGELFGGGHPAMPALAGRQLI